MPKPPIVLALIATLAALAGCSWLAPVPGDSGAAPSRGELTAALSALEEERRAFAADVAAARDELASVKEAAQATDGRFAGQLATVAANLEGRMNEGLDVLAQLDGAIEDAKTRLANLPTYEDQLTQRVAEVSATTEAVAPYIPSPFGEILGLVGVIGGSWVAARERSRRRRTEQERELAAEAVRDLNRGFDSWFGHAVTNGDKDAALDARRAMRGQLSERTRSVVAKTADHPIAAEG